MLTPPSRPTRPGALLLGFAGAGHGRFLSTASSSSTTARRVEGTDLGAAFLAPPSLPRRSTSPRGSRRASASSSTIEPRRRRSSGALALTVGIAPDDSDADGLIAEAAAAARAADVALVVVGTNPKVESEGYDRDRPRPARPAGRPRPRRRRGQPPHGRARQRRLPGRCCRGATTSPRCCSASSAARSSATPSPTSCPAPSSPAAACPPPGRRRRRTSRSRRRPPTDGVLRYDEGIHIGYRAWLRPDAGRPTGSATASATPTWSSGRRADADAAATRSTVTVAVANTSDRAGKQVVQVYAERPDSAVERPVRWLVGFAPVRAEAGRDADGRRSRSRPGAWRTGTRAGRRARRLHAARRHLGRRPAALRTVTLRSPMSDHALPNPLLPGFNPDPSVVKVGDDYYLATSTFEYLPGIPVYRSTDLVDWTLIGHVARPGRAARIAACPPAAARGRRRSGTATACSTSSSRSPMGRGMLHLHRRPTRPGPWSDGDSSSTASHGIDPDLAWDDDGTAVRHLLRPRHDGTGPRQARRHPPGRRSTSSARAALEDRASCGRAPALKFPEAPHLYRRGGHWYLMIAEGGTERGHGISIARADSPAGPFEPAPAQPLPVRAQHEPADPEHRPRRPRARPRTADWLMVLLGHAPARQDAGVLGARPRDVRDRRSRWARRLAARSTR